MTHGAMARPTPLPEPQHPGCTLHPCLPPVNPGVPQAAAFSPGPILVSPPGGREGAFHFFKMRFKAIYIADTSVA